MKGSEVIFIASRSHRHRGKPVLDAIVGIAHKHAIKRYTRRIDTEGTGASGHTHSVHFFELANEPEELMFVLDDGLAKELIRAVEESGAHVFCLRRSIDYWQFGVV